MKEIRHKESELVIGQTYYFDGMKRSYGIFKGYEEDKSPFFEPIEKGNYSKNSYGMISFSPLPECKWILKQ